MKKSPAGAAGTVRPSPKRPRLNRAAWTRSPRGAELNAEPAPDGDGVAGPPKKKTRRGSRAAGPQAPATAAAQAKAAEANGEPAAEQGARPRAGAHARARGSPRARAGRRTGGRRVGLCAHFPVGG